MSGSLAGNSNAVMSVAAHRGDAKTLLAFDILTENARRGLAGFTIQVQPPGREPYYLINDLRFEHPEDHAQDPSEPEGSSMNAPFRKFRWLHVPGLDHQGLDPAFGLYKYTVTPRYFSKRRLLPFDEATSVEVEVELAPFASERLKVGFTRGFVQSQAFARHFGKSAPIRPDGGELLFDTGSVAGTSPEGGEFTFGDEYRWSGFTARTRIFEILDEVKANPDLSLDVFAYDLNEPDIMKSLIGLAGRVRIILDKAALHHDKEGSKPEDRFERAFAEAAGGNAILRGKFGRYAHNKVFIVSENGRATKVLTGSTNLSVTGMYVNSNHVLVYDDPAVADIYLQVFNESWETKASSRFSRTVFANTAFAFPGREIPETSITFAPHTLDMANQVLDEIIGRIRTEADSGDDRTSVLFAVMELDSKAPNPVYEELNKVHKNNKIFSFGISDNPKGISLYKIGSGEGVLVTGKPGKRRLPAPFQDIRYVSFGHQVHHKFVVCGFRGDDPTVFCGSSNLALGGEQKNGDNLLTIKDAGVATVFAIEAVGLIDHFNYLNGLEKAGASAATMADANKREAAVRAKWFLGTTDFWVRKYFDPDDLHHRDRLLFAL